VTSRAHAGQRGEGGKETPSGLGGRGCEILAQCQWGAGEWHGVARSGARKRKTAQCAVGGAGRLFETRCTRPACPRVRAV